MNDELMQERFSLMRERISEIQKEELVKDPYRDFSEKQVILSWRSAGYMTGSGKDGWRKPLWKN